MEPTPAGTLPVGFFLSLITEITTMIEPVEHILARVLRNAKTAFEIGQAVGADRFGEAMFKIGILCQTGTVECRDFGNLLPPTFRIARAVQAMSVADMERVTAALNESIKSIEADRA